MKTNQITRKELNVQVRTEKYEVGTYLHYRGCSGFELWQIVSAEDENRFTIEQVNAQTLKRTGDSHTVTLGGLKEYYHPVNMDMDRIHDLSLRLLDGEELEEDLDGDADSTGTELMHLGDKATLVALRDELTGIQQVAVMVRAHAACIVDEIKRQLSRKVEKMEQMAAGMRKQIDRIEYVINTIETYAGIKEDIVTVQTGIPASEDTPVVIRQAVIYMDEEMALLDHDFDWTKIKSFDEWLVQDGNYKTLMPDLKSIVAIKPRRNDKVYSSGKTATDRWYNWTMNQNNHVTLFLIRNGENLYRIESEHIYLQDRFFPNEDEYLKIMEKEEEDKRRGWNSSRYGDSDADLFRKRYTRVSFLLQGLMDRSEVFAPHQFTGNLIKMTGLNGQVEMRYELDNSHLLGDGKPAFRDWLKTMSANLGEGKRILLVKCGNNHSGYSFDTNDFVNYYSNEYTTPEYPEDGIYTLYASKPKGYNKFYEDRHPFVIKYLPDDKSYSWSDGCRERKNRVSIHIAPHETGILNYDDLKMEDVDYYLHSRLHRSQYYQFMVMLKKVKVLLLEQQREEENFIRMMVGQMMSRELTVKKAFTPEEVVRLALDKVKTRLKWKRPVSTKERETYTLVERTLFSKAFISKYFNALETHK